jgi:hypothetical protein
MHRLLLFVVALFLLSACGGSSSGGKVGGAFRDRANAVCAPAVAALKEHPFPIQNFDPQNPTADQLRIVADYFSTYRGPEVGKKLEQLGEPKKGAAAWDRLRDVVRQSDANAQTQIAVARAGDVQGFKATVDKAVALHKKFVKAGPAAGFPARSACGTYYG